MRDYLTTADILGIHHILLEKYGGGGGIRDLGAVEASVFRAQCGYYKNILEESAALLESLLINHPFVDGNKRTALAACDVFLRVNGQMITGESDWLYGRLISWIDTVSDRLKLINSDLESCVAVLNE